MDNWIALLSKYIDIFLMMFMLILGILVRHIVDYYKQKLLQQRIDRRETLEQAKRSHIVKKNRPIFKNIEDIPMPDFSELLFDIKISECNVWPLYYSDKLHEIMSELRIPK